MPSFNFTKISFEVFTLHCLLVLFYFVIRDVDVGRMNLGFFEACFPPFSGRRSFPGCARWTSGQLRRSLRPDPQTGFCSTFRCHGKSPSRLSPNERSPSRLSPNERSPSRLSPNERSPSRLSPNERSPSRLSPNERSPSRLSPI